jgi:CRP/FNR family nitrogen fixation transcriptional regulator
MYTQSTHTPSTATRLQDRNWQGSARPPPEVRLRSLDSFSTTKTYCRNQEIYGQEQPAEAFYKVLSGTVRLCITRVDGRRQIIDLLLPDDVFGFASRGEYDYSAEAVETNTRIAAYPRRRIEALAEGDPQVARVLHEIMCRCVSRLQSQLRILGRITAREKVGSFLLEMADRLSDKPARKVILPISRYDIADYLAISVETVSRSLTDLKQRGVIALVGTRRVKIIDRHALEDG